MAAALDEDTIASGSSNIYQPLQASNNQIRLLSLQPRQYNRTHNHDEDQLICLLKPASLSSSPDFLALSYSWENGLPPQQILISGHPRLVSANLADALRQLRHDSNDVTLWTDQLCINQADPTEKAAQIQKMHSIYEEASTVISWLGRAQDASDSVFEALNYIGTHHQLAAAVPARKLRSSSSSLPRGKHTPLPSSGSYDSKYISLTRPTSIRALCNGLSAFASRRYWTRLWVLQEFAVATNLLIMCGSSSITFSTLRLAWRTLRKAEQRPGSSRSQTIPSLVEEQQKQKQLTLSIELTALAKLWFAEPASWDAYLGIERFLTKREQFWSGVPLDGGGAAERDEAAAHHHVHVQAQQDLFTTMYTTLTTFSGTTRLNSMDPRDRVFGLLSLASDAEDTFGLLPDYTLSVEEVYEDVAVLFLKQGYVDVLSFCQEDVESGGGVGSRRGRIASWAPDWEQKLRIPAWGKVDMNASRGWGLEADVEVVYVNDGLDVDGNSRKRKKAIRISGIVIGVIAEHGAKWSLEEHMPLTILQTQTFLTEIHWFCEGSKAATAAAACEVESNDQILLLGEDWAKVEKQIKQRDLDLMCALVSAPTARAHFPSKQQMLFHYRELLSKCQSSASSLSTDPDIPLNKRPPTTTSPDQHGEPNSVTTSDSEGRSMGSNSAQSNVVKVVAFDSQYEKDVRTQLLRCPFLTLNGHVGLAPPYVRPGDSVVVFPGSQTPYILREVKEEKIRGSGVGGGRGRGGEEEGGEEEGGEEEGGEEEGGEEKTWRVVGGAWVWRVMKGELFAGGMGGGDGKGEGEGERIGGGMSSFVLI